MQVRIEHSENSYQQAKTGLFGRFKSSPTYTDYVVDLFLTFSEEERATLAEFKLWDTPVYQTNFKVRDYYLEGKSQEERDMFANEVITYTIGGLVEKQPFGQYFFTPAEAIAYEAQLKNDVLPRIKSIIMSNSGGRKSSSFEL